MSSVNIVAVTSLWGFKLIKAVIKKWVSCVSHNYPMSEGWWLSDHFAGNVTDVGTDWLARVAQLLQRARSRTCISCPLNPCSSHWPGESFPWKVAPEPWLRNAGARGQLRCDKRHSVWLFPSGEPGAAVSLRVVLKHTILICTRP